MRQAVALAAGRVPLEASGGVTLERAAEIAATGVDYLSVGALTHSAKALDLSMKIVKPGRAARQERPGGPHRRGQGDAGRAAGHPGPPLPARRGAGLCRFPGRLPQAGPRRRARPTPSSSSSAASILWPRRRPSWPDRASACSSPTRAPAATWPTQPRPKRCKPPGSTCPAERVHAHHLCQFFGGAEGLLRPARRHRLHLGQRGAGHPLGAGPAPPRLLFPRPAPGPQHGPAAGHPAGRDAAVGHVTARPAPRRSGRPR